MRSHSFTGRLKGFTLVEVIIYLGILSVISAGGVTLILSLDGVLAQFKVETALYRSSTNVLEQVVVALREGEDFDAANSVLNTPATGKLTILNGGVTTAFEKSGSDLNLTIDGLNKGDLLSQGVSVTGFTVYKYNTTVGTFVRVKLNLSATVEGVTKTITLYDGAVIRGDL